MGTSIWKDGVLTVTAPKINNDPKKLQAVKEKTATLVRRMIPVTATAGAALNAATKVAAETAVDNDALPSEVDTDTTSSSNNNGDTDDYSRKMNHFHHRHQIEKKEEDVMKEEKEEEEEEEEGKDELLRGNDELR